MHGKGKSGSELGFVQALSPTAVAAGGSTGVFDFGAYSWVTMVVPADGAGMTVKLMGSAASDSGFAETGLSLTTIASQLAVRSGRLGLSQKYLRVDYDDNDAGVTAAVILVGDEARSTPINQFANTNVFSNVL